MNFLIQPKARYDWNNSKSLIAVILFGAFVWLAGSGFDRLLLTEGVTRFHVLLISNALTGVVAACLFWLIRIKAEQKQRLTEQRLQKVAEMNHHIRNALQVVANFAHETERAESRRKIDDSIRRIEWALREVLPKGWNLERADRGPGQTNALLRIPNSGGGHAANVENQPGKW